MCTVNSFQAYTDSIQDALLLTSIRATTRWEHIYIINGKAMLTLDESDYLTLQFYVFVQIRLQKFLISIKVLSEIWKMKDKYLFSTIISQLHGHVSSHLGKQTITRQNSQAFLTIRHTINPSKRIGKKGLTRTASFQTIPVKSVEQKQTTRSQITGTPSLHSSIFNLIFFSTTQAVSPAILSVMYSFCTNIYITCNSNCMLWNTTAGSI